MWRMLFSLVFSQSDSLKKKKRDVWMYSCLLVVLYGSFITVSQWWCWQCRGDDLSPLPCQHSQVPLASSVPVTYNQHHSLATKLPSESDQSRHKETQSPDGCRGCLWTQASRLWKPFVYRICWFLNRCLCRKYLSIEINKRSDACKWWQLLFFYNGCSVVDL